ncbi:Uncharacterised protein [Budvicia aquatica]|uniref:Uncharacterized protein n=2 Tax=Budvicia aquatica TaxID=82979 RepID=A0A484ZDP9_9GAMM|nr:Uncharacterised protein [Budvicia aquatica]
MGILEVDNAGYANRSTINVNGWMMVSMYQGWNQATGSSAGLDFKAAQADNTTVNGGGLLSVYAGGIVKDTRVNGGGVLLTFLTALHR